MVSAQSPDFLTMGSGGTNAAYFQVATGIAKLVNAANIGAKLNARSTAGSIANINAMASGDLEMGLTQNDIAAYAANGQAMFEGKKLGNLKAIGNLYPEYVQILARADRKVVSVADLRGKRVVVGAEGSSNAETARQILEIYGVSFSDLQAMAVSPNQALALMRDNRADAVFFTGALEAPAITALTAEIPLNLLEVDTEHARQLSKKYPFYRSVTLPGGIYPGNPVTVLGVSLFSLWAVRDTVSADVVYQMMKATFENPQFSQIYPGLERFSLAQALYNLPLPLHPGAERFYLEKGLLKLK